MIGSERQNIRDRLIHLFTNSVNDISIHFPIDVIEVISSHHEEAKLFSKNPSQYLQQLLIYLQKELVNKVFVSSEESNVHKKLQIARRLQNTHIMYTHVPFTRQLYKQFSQINSDDVGKWIVVTGTVIQSTTKKTLEKSKLFECHRCQAKIRIRTTYENNYKFQIPPECVNKVLKEKNSFFSKFFQKSKKQKENENQEKTEIKTLQKCGCSRFDPLDEGKICVDYQELKMQQQFQYITSGRIPRTIIVVVEGDLQSGGTLRPGDDLTITGLLTYRYHKLKKEYHVVPYLILYANHIVIQKTNTHVLNDELTDTLSMLNTESQLFGRQTNKLHPSSLYSEYDLSKEEIILVKQIELRNDIIKSFSSGIYGREMVKLGLLLSLLGGVSLENENSKIRGNSHTLLVGQPGTGKSVLLKEISKLSQRSFFTNGIGTTSAGLSVSHYKQGNDWMIEAGALVLADNGICCIDQLTLLSKKDEKSLLEAMEQQTISSAKASVIGKLNARTTVICACNPIRPGQKYDEELDLEANTGLSIPLLTRFDMIFVIKDEKDISEDAEKCDHILSNFMNLNDGLPYSAKKHQPQKINLRSLIKEAKEISPELNNHEIFSIYYTEERKRDSKVKTARAFESLCRIAQAHAKLMLRQETNQFDCLTAIMLTQNRYISTLEGYYEYLEEFNEKYHTNLT